jgi:hypothetical protein
VYSVRWSGSNWEYPWSREEAIALFGLGSTEAEWANAVRIGLKSYGRHVRLVNEHIFSVGHGFTFHGCTECINDFMMTWYNALHESKTNGRKFYRELVKAGTIAKMPPIDWHDVARASMKVAGFGLKATRGTTKTVAKVGYFAAMLPGRTVMAATDALDLGPSGSCSPRGSGGYDYRRHYGVGKHHGH